MAVGEIGKRFRSLTIYHQAICKSDSTPWKLDTLESWYQVSTVSALGNTGQHWATMGNTGATWHHSTAINADFNKIRPQKIIQKCD